MTAAGAGAGGGRDWFDRLSSALLAVVLALMVWLVSNGDARPMETRDAFPSPPDALGIAFRHVPEGRGVYEPSASTARLRLRGAADSLGHLKPTDFDVWLDLSNLPATATQYTGTLLADCPACRQRAVRITGIEPAEVAVSIGPVVTRTHAVVVDRTADSDPDYFVTAAVDPAQVTLRGAESQLAQVDSVLARVGDVRNLRSNRSFQAVDVVPVDASRQPVLGIEVVPGEVNVFLIVQRRGVELSISVALTGTLADGFVLDGWQVQPQWVQLEGPRDVLQTINTVSTELVDYTDFTESREVPVQLVLPEGVRALNAPDGVTVTVKVVAPGSRTFDVPVRARGVARNLVATVSPDRARVLLGGTQTELDAVPAETLEAFVDLSGKPAGRHRLSIQIDPPPGVLRRSITPEEVEVLLEPATPTVRP